MTRCVSLRGLISTLATLCVAIVASLTLALTLTTSLQALRSVGKDHALSLLNNARLSSRQMLDLPQDTSEALANLTLSQDWPWPSDDPAVFDAYRMYSKALYANGKFAINSIIMYFADNTRIMHTTTYDVGEEFTYPRKYINERHLVAPSLSAVGGNHTLQGNQTVVRRIFYTSNQSEMPANDPRIDTLVTLETPAKFYGTSWWRNEVLLPTGGGRFRTVIGVYAASLRDAVENYLIFSTPLFRPSDVPGTSQYGAVAVAVAFNDLSSYLRRARGTPNTEAFGLDDLGFLMGSSMAKPFITNTPTTASALVPTGCTSTARAGAASRGGSFLSCRAHASQYGYTPLTAMYSDRSHVLAEEPTVKILDVDGNIYFGAAATVEQRFRGANLHLVLLMPEKDVIGDVVATRNTTIGVTCAVCVVVAALIFIAISLLLAPLSKIAQRMIRASNFEDDDADAEVSMIAEVGDLQEAYYAMNDELNRIRAYVPQSVLFAKRLDASDEFDDDPDLSASVHTVGDADATASTQLGWEVSSQRSNRSVRSTRSKRTTMTTNSGRAALACGILSSKAVTVLTFNIRDFSRATQGRSLSAAAATVGAFVQAVGNAVNSHGGVVSTTHGDHVTATFNAVSNCASGPRKASLAALQVTGEHAPSGFRIACGVASGPCLVGNVGSEEVKSFSVIGPAFTQALALERLTRVYGPGCQVLATGRVCMDIATHVRFRLIDMTALPGKRAALVGALLGLTRSTENADHSKGDDEWLYLVGADRANDHNGIHNDAFVALQRGDFATASQAITDSSRQAFASHAFAAAVDTFAPSRAASATDAVTALCDASRERLAVLVEQARRNAAGTGVTSGSESDSGDEATKDGPAAMAFNPAMRNRHASVDLSSNGVSSMLGVYYDCAVSHSTRDHAPM